MQRTTLLRVLLLQGLLPFCCACIGTHAAGKPEQNLVEVRFNEQAGEGDFSVSLQVRRDSTFYHFYNVGRRRTWSGKTNKKFWAQLERTTDKESLAQVQNAQGHQRYDGHSASIYVRQKDSSYQFVFDLMQNSAEVTSGSLYKVLRREQDRLYNLSGKAASTNP